MADTLVDWLLTYLLHSTLLLGLAFCAHRLLGERRLALQEALFRAALLGGIVTSSLQVGLACVRLGRSPPAGSGGAASRSRVSARLACARGRGPLGRPCRQSRALASREPQPTGDLRGLIGVWRPSLLAAWALLAGLGLVRFSVAWLRMRRLLSGRRALIEGEVVRDVSSVATALGIQGRVRLSTAPRLVVPVAVA